MPALKSTVTIFCLLAIALSGCGGSSNNNDSVAGGTGGNGGAGGSGGAGGGNFALKAESAMPPGQSGFISIANQLQGQLSGNPGDYGPHVDDQRLLYWNFDAKPGALGSKPGTPVSPKAGVQIYRDAYGVPIVYAETVHDLWYGVGYAVAQDRLFLMDAVRRTGAGTLSELTGCGGVPADLQQRITTYTDAEYQAMFDSLPQVAKDSVQGYIDGANAWREEAVSDPNKLPAEYALLTTTPTEFTIKDVLAAGVYITRFVAAEGGNEFLNIRMLKELQAEYGSVEEAKKAFLDMTWLEDDKAAVSVPRSVGSFSNQPEPAAGREAVFSQMADWAITLPETVWKGPGTGHSAAPFPCSQPSLAMRQGGAGDMGAREVLQADASRTRQPAHKGMRAQASTGMPIGKSPSQLARLRATQQAVRNVVQALQELRAYLHGGSMAYAIAPSRTRDGGTLMVSGPQLGYSYPLLLVEYEIHGAGYHARGSSVPILPTVGIGYTEHAAWGLTTGYSKTIDSFIETICSTSQVSAGTCQANQYFHQGQWKNMDCRTETLNYRAASNGVPVGPPSLSTTAQVCRTVHGPVVARDDGAGLARSLQYAMYGREIDTITGILEWNKATSFAEFKAGVEKVTWNENVTVATRDGHIAYFHPGLFRARSPNADMRLPIPGTGDYDFGGYLPFAQLPQAIDPPQGFVANWNNKPAYGWLDGEGLGSTSRPGGAGQRVTSILDLLATRQDWAFEDLRDIDQHHGTLDHRAREYLPVIQSFRTATAAQLTDVQKAALDLMLGWDRIHYGPNIDLADENAKDGPAATIFGEYVVALRDELFAGLKDNIIDPGVPDGDPNNPNPEAGLTVYGRVSGVGSHVFDQSVMDNLVLRILNPASSGLSLRRDYTGGRGRDAIMLAALNVAMDRLADNYNNGTPLAAADLPKCTRVHPRSMLCSLTGVIGPGSDTVPGTRCVTMPYQDRGSWVHRVGYEKP
jgi:penicillin G amidase